MAADTNMKLPKWLKTSLIVAGILAVLFFGLIAGCTFLSFNMVRDAKDPSKMNAVVASFMTLREPLPSGLKLVSASDMGLKTVLIKDSRTDLEIDITRDPSGLQKQSTSKNLVDGYLNFASEQEKTLAKMKGKGSTFDLQTQVVKKGNLIVGTRTLEYAIARYKDKNSAFVKCLFVGYFAPKDNAVISIRAVSKNTNLDLKRMLDFLSRIEFI